MSFGVSVVLVLGVYLVFLLSLGVYARGHRKSNSLADFYLAGRNLGPFVLLLTLYATQYSGNSLVAYPAEAFRMGFGWTMSVGFMMAIIVVYLVVAPRLSVLARRHGYVTPGDWLDHRFGSPTLSLVANTLLVFAITNYLLAQLMAIGHVVEGLSDGAVPYLWGVVLFTLVIIVYETLGGLRAVAWTDCIQGLLLFVGLGGLLLAAGGSSDTLRQTTEWILANEPQKAVVPPGSISLTWMSTVLLIGFSGAVYPQAIQRIYAAKSTNALRQSLSVMIFMPLVTIFTVVLVGIFAIERFAGLEGLTADQVMPMMLREWASVSGWNRVMALLVVTGVVAAIMSTADSVLLSLSSMLSKDFVGKHLARDASEEKLTSYGKALSWVAMAVLVSIALVPRISLWGLLELKMEILVQVSPAFLLGLTWRRLSASGVLAGMVAGTLFAAGFTLAGYGKIAGIHAGLIGWALNVALAVTVSLATASARQPALAKAT